MIVDAMNTAGIVPKNGGFSTAKRRALIDIKNGWSAQANSTRNHYREQKTLSAQSSYKEEFLFCQL